MMFTFSIVNEDTCHDYMDVLLMPVGKKGITRCLLAVNVYRTVCAIQRIRQNSFWLPVEKFSRADTRRWHLNRTALKSQFIKDGIVFAKNQR